MHLPCAITRILDNLPVAMVKMRKDDRTNTLIKTYERGYPVGFKASLEVRGCWRERHALCLIRMPCRRKCLMHRLIASPCSEQGQSDVKFFLHNHLRYTILYHKDSQTDLARIVGFEVEPFSAKHTYEGVWDKSSPVLDTCNPGRMIYVTHNLPPQPVAEGNEVIFSYDVRFQVKP